MVDIIVPFSGIVFTTSAQ